MVVPENIDLAHLQRKAVLAQREDGLAELLAGALLSSIAAWLLLDRGAWGGIMPALLVLAVAALRRGVRYPRVGYMRPSAPVQPRRGSQVLSVLIVLAAGGALLWLALGGAAGITLAPQQMQLALGGTAVLVLACTGLYWSQGRWYAYAGVVALAVLITYTAHAPTAYGMLAGGVLLLVWGTTMLARFMHRYPVLSNQSGEFPPASSTGKQN